MQDDITKDRERIRTMFDEISDSYDLLNRILSGYQDLRWRRKLIDQAKPSRFLDLACGSGDVMKIILENKSVSRLAGLDLSMNMLSKASSKCSTSEDENFGVYQGDALNMPFHDDSFDTTSCAFGVRNFEDRTSVYEEIQRVVERSGRLLILEFFPPNEGIMGGMIQFYLNNVLPSLGRLISGSDYAYEYLQKSIESFPDIDVFVEELENAGFRDVKATNLFLGLVYIVSGTVR